MHYAVREATAYQRGLAVQEEDVSQQALVAENCEIIELIDAEREAFRAAVAPMYDEARETFGNTMFDLLPK